MSQVTPIIRVLKGVLKTRGVTYADVAHGLQMSEANIKRMFAEERMTLQRLEEVCQLVGLELSDLFHLFDEQQHRISHLNERQEKELVANMNLLLVAVCARNHWTFQDILDSYEISEAELIRCLAQLDRLGLIELLPGNRIKLRIQEGFRWLPGGPIEQFFEQNVQQEFLRSGFTQTGQCRHFLTGMLSPASHGALMRKLEELVQQFSLYHAQDASRPLDQRCNVGLVLAFRPWEFSVFRKMRRDSARKI